MQRFEIDWPWLFRMFRRAVKSLSQRGRPHNLQWSLGPGLGIRRNVCVKSGRPCRLIVMVIVVLFQFRAAAEAAAAAAIGRHRTKQNAIL